MIQMTMYSYLGRTSYYLLLKLDYFLNNFNSSHKLSFLYLSWLRLTDPTSTSLRPPIHPFEIIRAPYKPGIKTINVFRAWRELNWDLLKNSLKFVHQLIDLSQRDSLLSRVL